MPEPGRSLAGTHLRPCLTPEVLPLRRTSGFTLIELMAVALLMALVAAIALPNMGFRAAQQALEEAESLAALFEFGRQRAVMTGRPQRVMIDLDGQRYWLEHKRALEKPESEPVGGTAQGELAMRAPREESPAYSRAIGSPGRGYSPPAGVWISAIDTAEGRLEAGEISIPFAWDGSTEGTVLWIGADGGHQVRLEIAPLADRIRIERVEL